MSDLIPVKYIGRFPEFEYSNHAKILFAKDETKLIPFELANRLLAHTDLFAVGVMPTKPLDIKKIDTVEVEEEETYDYAKNTDERELVMAMTDYELVGYAGTFNLKQGKKESIDALRSRVLIEIDTVGV